MRSAIDEARTKDPQFDRELRERLAISERLQALAQPADDATA